MSRRLPPPPDQAERETIVRSRDRSILVEASAGTGKTHTLVEALLHGALDATQRIRLSEVAAVTFTEKAAGELKARLSSLLLEAANAGDAARRGLAREALDDVERAEVSTIHAFCQTLLKERPVDAGVDPDFTPIDEVASRALAARVWHDWWRREVEQAPAGPVAEALRAGASLGRPEEDRPSLSQLAFALYKERARLDGAPPAEDAPRLLPGLLRGWANQLARAASEASNPGSQAVQDLRQMAEWLGNLARLSPTAKFAREAGNIPKVGFQGASKLWPRERSERIQKLVKRIERRIEKLPAQAGHWPLLAGVLGRLRDAETGFFGAVAAEKRRRGLVDFDDLLLLARDLLRRSAPARAHFRRRFRLIAVDEFQDTDPLQMEIVARLAGAEGGDEDWRAIVPEPGRLLLVGDPKQSIYRFRRADVESYRRMSAGLDRRTLSANRRSLPSLLAWINAAFEELLNGAAGKPWEIAYEPFQPWRQDEGRGRPPVVYLEPPPGWTGSGSSREASEAEAVAEFVFRSVEEKRFRPGQAAILVRTNDRVADFQEALDRYEIPSVLEGGRDFFQREETAAVLSALTALEDPRDSVSLYALLKSSFFSFSDEDLFRAREAGARFDYTDTRRRPADPRLAEAFALLARLRRDRHARPAAETLADLYEATGAVEAAASQRVGGLQAQANLERILVAARGLSEGGLSFGSLVRALKDRTGGEAGEPRAFEEDVEAVRILTMHKAKGLEFPVTIVTGLGAEGMRSSSGPVVFGGPGTWGASLGIGGIRVETPDVLVATDENKERELAEEKRLFYVSCTRAEDLLVISHFRDIRETKKGPSDAGDKTSTPFGRFRRHLDRAAQVPGLVERLPLQPGPRAVPEDKPPVPTPAPELARQLAELARRPEQLAGERSARLRRPGRAEGAEAAEDLPAGERERIAVSDKAARLGSAVHEAMQSVVERGTGVPRAAAEAAAAWELSAGGRRDVEELSERLVRSPLFARSAAARRRFSELPVLFRDGSGFLVEGKIDLLFEEDPGFVLVDYKTDRDLSVRLPEYRAQLNDYAAALSALGLGKPVVEAYLLSARTGEAVAVPLGAPG